MANTVEALADLQGVKCAGCDGTKRTRNSFCLNCYLHLPSAMQKALWNSARNGYAEAFTAARKWLWDQRAEIVSPEEQEMLFGEATNG